MFSFDMRDGRVVVLLARVCVLVLGWKKRGRQRDLWDGMGWEGGVGVNEWSRKGEGR